MKKEPERKYPEEFYQAMKGEKGKELRALFARSVMGKEKRREIKAHYRKILIGLVLILLLIFLSLRYFPGLIKKEVIRLEVLPEKITEKPISPEVKEEEPAALPEVKREKGVVSWGRDPFLSPLVKGVPEEGVPKVGVLILTGIVRDEKGAQAIIGDYIVNVGDIINGKRVISIKKNKVVLIKGKERETLKLEEE